MARMIISRSILAALLITVARAQRPADDAPPRADFPSEHEIETDGIEWQKTGKLRRVQADSFFPLDDPYWNPNGIMERKPCIPFENIRSEQITNPNADGECSTNTCNGGCCRNYNWLLCDTDSSFAYVSCVCNSETWPPDQWTKAPTVQRPTTPTPPPSPSPTLAPITPAPTSTPSNAPIMATPAPVASTEAPVAAAGTQPPMATNAPEAGDCPLRVRTTCATVDGDIPCVQVPIPTDPSSPNCNVTVIYTYNMTNFGDDIRRVYALTVLRNDQLIIVTDDLDESGRVPIIILEPGESYIAQGGEWTFSVCTERGVDIFDAKVDILGGIPVTSNNTATCISDEGEDCAEIVQDPTNDDCLLSVTYNYTVQNAAEKPFDIWRFNVTRNGETRDLFPLLGENNRVEIGQSTSLQETEEVNRCEPISPSRFETELWIRKNPPFDALCDDTYYYPIGMIPDQY